MRHAILALPLATILAIPLLAQDVPELTEGQRVRIKAPGVVVNRLQAILLAREGDTLLLRALPLRREATLVRVPLSAIERLEVGDARSRGAGALRGLWIGGLTGILLGGTTGLLQGENGELDRAGNAAFGAALLGTAGMVIGTLFGAISPGHRWTSVELPARVGFAPIDNNTAGLALSIRTR
jgi:hypothetical protein